MKKVYTVISFVLMCLVSQAQTQAPATTKKAAPVREFKEVTPLTYESELAQGKLTLLRTLRREAAATTIYATTYSLSGSGTNASFNNGKPMDIKLSKDFYTGSFLGASTDIAAKAALLNSFVQNKNLLLTEESGWISLINYYNGL